MTLTDVEDLITGRLMWRRAGSASLGPRARLRFRLACADGYLVCRSGEYHHGRVARIWRAWCEATGRPVVAVAVRGTTAMLYVDPIVRGAHRGLLTPTEHTALLAAVLTHRPLRALHGGAGYFTVGKLSVPAALAVAAQFARGLSSGDFGIREGMA